MGGYWRGTGLGCEPSPCAEQITVYVNAATGDDSWDGLCEEWDGVICGPKATIQAGMDAAQPGDTVIVGDGTYIGVGNKNLDYGGKAITVRSAGGAPETCIIDCEGNGRGCSFQNGETLASVLDGFTITNGALEGEHGSGVYCLQSSPTISNCTFLNNEVVNGFGGGIFLEGGAPLIVSCTFTNCDCYCDSMPEPETRGGGGGICSIEASPLIMYCVFEGCLCHDWAWVTYGGGGILCNGGAPLIVYNRFQQCSAEIKYARWGEVPSAFETRASSLSKT
jgi:hypothetical protein